MNVKINDNVLVISGKYSGKQGKVIASDPKHGTVTVEGINIHKKAQKARKANEVSQIVDVEAPMDVSNVMVICAACGKATRVKHSVEGGKKVRLCAKCNAVLDGAAPKAGKKAVKKEEAPQKRVRKRAKKETTPETATSDDKAE